MNTGKDSIVLIDKAAGITSFDCLKFVKRYVNKKCGHCGTLDKFATGLIIALCGKYTHFNEAFMGMDKTYVAKIKFGEETETLDPEGKIIATADIPDKSTVFSEVSKYTGEMMQVPPAYSAIHLNGQRSYNLARKGNEVKLEPRKVIIKNAVPLYYDDRILTVLLEVSKGTYIRSYARDLAVRCGSRGYVVELRRTKIGPFSVDEAVPYNDEKSLCNTNEQDVDYLLNRLTAYKNGNI